MKLLPTLAAIFLLSGCNLGSINPNNVKYRTVVKDATYRLSIPDFLDSTSQLNKEANLQFANTRKEFYFVLFHERKEDVRSNLILMDSLHQLTDTFSVRDAYFDFMNRNLAQQPSYKLFNQSDTIIKKTAIKMASMNLDLEKAKAFYRVAVVEGRTSFYQIYVWTLDSKKEQYQPIMDSIIRSFHEL